MANPNENEGGKRQCTSDIRLDTPSRHEMAAFGGGGLDLSFSPISTTGGRVRDGHSPRRIASGVPDDRPDGSGLGIAMINQASGNRSSESSATMSGGPAATGAIARMLVVSEWVDSTAGPPILERIGNIFLQDPTAHVARCAVASLEQDYEVDAHPCNSIAEWKNANNCDSVEVTRVEDLPEDILKHGSTILVERERSTNQIAPARPAPWIAQFADRIKQAELDAKLEPIAGKLSELQIRRSNTLLDEFLGKAEALLLDRKVLALPFVNSPTLEGKAESVISLEHWLRPYNLALVLRRRLDKKIDDNSTQELKYCTEEIYEPYSDPRGCLERDLEKLCRLMHISPCEIGATTTPLRRAYGPLLERTKDGDLIDWRASQNYEEGLGKTITTRYRNHIDGIEDDIEEFVVKCNGSVVNAIFWTEDMYMYKELRKVYVELGIVVVHMRGFSDRNARGFIKLLKERFFPHAVVTGLTDLDLYGLRQIQANKHNESLTTSKDAYHANAHASNYSFESQWLGLHPSDIKSLRENGVEVPSTKMDDKTAKHLERFMEKSAFPACGPDPDRRQEELSLLHEMKEVVKMEQVPRDALFDLVCGKLRKGDYGC